MCMQWNLYLMDFSGPCCCYAEFAPFQLYCHGPVGSAELIIFREVKCIVHYTSILYLRRKKSDAKKSVSSGK